MIRKVALLTIIVLVFICSFGAAAPAVQDSWTARDNPNTNYSAFQSIHSSPRSTCNNSDYIAFIKFNIETLPQNPTEVYLSVHHVPHTSYCFSNCSADFYFYKVTSDWDETTLTHNNSPSIGGQVYGPVTINFPNDLGRQEYDITQIYNEWIDGTSENYGLAIYSPTVGCNNAAVGFSFYSSKNSDESLHPYLRIVSAEVEPTDKDIVDTAIAADPEFSTLVAAVTAAGLADTLKGPGPFTVFAPTDAAFAALPAGVLDKLLANPDILAKVLLYHVVPGAVLAADVVGLDGQEVTTAQGQKVSISVSCGVFVNDANVIDTDILCTNGVIHVIDKVLVPEWDIVEAAILNDDFNTLVAALEAAGLADTLKGPGPFTVFAPTDDAFAALLAALDITAGELLASDDLTNILLYHVVSGKYEAGDLYDGMELEALNGGTLVISISSIKVNDANVIAADVETTNGVIHVLDAVLIPAEDLGDGDVELPQTGGYPYFVLGLLALAGGALSLKKRK